MSQTELQELYALGFRANQIHEFIANRIFYLRGVEKKYEEALELVECKDKALTLTEDIRAFHDSQLLKSIGDYSLPLYKETEMKTCLNIMYSAYNNACEKHVKEAEKKEGNATIDTLFNTAAIDKEFDYVSAKLDRVMEKQERLNKLRKEFNDLCKSI